MNRRNFLKAAGAGMLSAIALPKFAAGQTTPVKPNVVLILVDDLGWADVGCYCAQYGNTWYETPNIDRLASQGMKFTQGYAACAVCSPTRAATLTGRYPARLGVTDWIRPSESTTNPQGYEGSASKEVLCPKNYVFMDSSEITIAEMLKPAGYTTCHVGKWHLGGSSFYPGAQGFDYNYGGCSWGHPFQGYFDPYGIPTLPPRQTGEYLTVRESDEALGFIETAVGQEKPFFLYMAHYAVHMPIQAIAEIKQKYDNKPKPTGYENLNSAYAAMIESVDNAVGAIMDKLDALGVADNTVVIFTSDNGGHVSVTTNKPLRSGKGYPYEGGIREPWIVRWPGKIAPGSTCDTPIISPDALPTICEMTAQPLPRNKTIDGVSLVPLLKQSGKIPERTLFWHYPHYRDNAELPYSVIRDEQWKLIKRYAGPAKYELFDLKNDMSETTNMASSKPDIVKMLDEKLTGWIQKTKGKIPITNPAYKKAAENKRAQIG
ncbi:MAG: sulfatase-like hydrolase/transferase [Phycisphaerae bacterium]|nr:sulfatase-like hydrolase/transferase [Phycisphaerae bacterium]